jgi:DNA-binding LacI/PurR family transcriptional regulator
MAPDRARRLTLRDVAAELGVSAKTVSNAYVHTDQLSAELRQRIIDTAARLGYPGPDPVAAGLRRGRVGAIGVAYDNRLSYAFDDPTTSALLAGITTVAEAAGAGLLLLPGSSDHQRRTVAVTGAVIDGLIASSVSDDDALLHTVIIRRLPLVVIDQPSPDRLAELGAATAPWVGIDDQAAAATAAAHLLQLGHRRLGVVSFGLSRGRSAGFADQDAQAAATYAVTRRRLAGYRAAVERHGIDWPAVPVWAGTDSTADQGDAGATAVLARTPRPTALLCLSDRLAEGALRAAARLGLLIPDDLSIVAFDDAVPLAATLNLTTVRQPSRDKGQYAAQALLDLLAGHQVPPDQLLPTELVIRRSSARPTQPMHSILEPGLDLERDVGLFS